MTDDDFIAAANLNADEARAWVALRDAAGAVMRLVTDDPVHSMEAAEVATAIHHVQARLLARPALRALRDADNQPPRCGVG